MSPRPCGGTSHICTIQPHCGVPVVLRVARHAHGDVAIEYAGILTVDVGPMLGRTVTADALLVPRATARLPQPGMEGVVRDVASVRMVLPYRRGDVQVAGPFQARKVCATQVESAALAVGGLVAALSRALAIRDIISARHDGNIGTRISGPIPATVMNPAPAASGMRPVAAVDAAHLGPPRPVENCKRITVA